MLIINCLSRFVMRNRIIILAHLRHLHVCVCTHIRQKSIVVHPSLAVASFLAAGDAENFAFRRLATSFLVRGKAGIMSDRQTARGWIEEVDRNSWCSSLPPSLPLSLSLSLSLGAQSPFSLGPPFFLPRKLSQLVNCTGPGSHTASLTRWHGFLCSRSKSTSSSFCTVYTVPIHGSRSVGGYPP